MSSGYSKFVKDSFETQGATQNAHGWYQGAGSLTILTRNGGAEPITRGSQSADPYRSGFDWFRFPGTTSPHRPADCSKDFKNLTHFRGKFASHSNAFVGGTKSVDGNAAAWGFHFEDLHNPDVSDALVASTSRFFFRQKNGNAFVLSLGSNITGGAPKSPDDWDDVTTNLFQNLLSSDSHPFDNMYSMLINNERVSAIHFDSAVDNPNLADNAVVRIRDSLGIGYVVVGGNGRGRLRVVRAEQNISLENCNHGKKPGNWSTAYIEHGVAPTDASYEYSLLLAANITSDTLDAFVPSKVYSVLATSGLIHAVKLLETETLAIVTFGGVNMPDGVVSETGNIVSVSKACAIVAQLQQNLRQDICVSFSVANPDLGYFDGGKTDFNYGYSGHRREAFTRRSRPQTITMTLKGIWSSGSTEAREVENYLLGGSDSGPGDHSPLQFAFSVSNDAEADVTLVTIVNQNGVPVQFSMCRTLTSAPSSSAPFSRSPSPAPSTASPSATSFLSAAPSTSSKGCKRLVASILFSSLCLIFL